MWDWWIMSSKPSTAFFSYPQARSHPEAWDCSCVVMRRLTGRKTCAGGRGSNTWLGPFSCVYEEEPQADPPEILSKLILFFLIAKMIHVSVWNLGMGEKPQITWDNHLVYNISFQHFSMHMLFFIAIKISIIRGSWRVCKSENIPYFCLEMIYMTR